MAGGGLPHPSPHRTPSSYAEYQAGRDNFDAAIEAYLHAGRPELATRMLNELTHNAVVERRFSDAARHLNMLSQHSRKTNERGAARAQELRKRAEVYYAYSFVHQCESQVFMPADVMPQSLFNIARFLSNVME